ncbi:MAG: response regulator [Sulfuricurvum sp.]|uniref:response regulator n=1 Tax=Sulfuricurvum sp. TaxID=2025608 RepID=UPI0027325E24|nr:response regulator [Sulfuricurvum sp.]MDP3292561.1 response regulator [Sulfuricurvum sp.]
MKNYLHSLTNSLHQITGYASLLRKYPDKVDEYAMVIEKNAYIIEGIMQELFQLKHADSPSFPIRFDSTSVVGKKVLIVDDMRENREILMDIFHTLKCEVESAENGSEALTKAELFDPDIICIDIVMPGMNGYETATALHNAGSSATLVAISALREDRSKNVFDAWLSKPFTADQIMTLLSSESLNSTMKENQSIDLSSLSHTFRHKLLDAIDKGALSQSEMLVSTLDQGACKTWLSEQLREMNLETIRTFIMSAHSSETITY